MNAHKSNAKKKEGVGVCEYSDVVGRSLFGAAFEAAKSCFQRSKVSIWRRYSSFFADFVSVIYVEK